MRRFFFFFSILAFLCSHTLHAKSGSTLRQINSSASRAATLSSTTCLVNAGLSSEDKTTYNKIKDIVPDALCCAKSDTEGRKDCLDDNLENMQHLYDFLNNNFHDGENPSANCGLGSFDLEMSVQSVKCELSQLTGLLH